MKVYKPLTLLRTFAAIAVLAGGTACKSTIGTGKFLATQQFPDKNLEQLSNEKVEGQGCRQHIFFVPIGEQNYNAAFRDALSKSPEGTTGFMHAELGTIVPAPFVGGGILFGRFCNYIIGYPAKAKLPTEES